jgi:N-methyl-L-tryptophan oxidase
MARRSSAIVVGAGIGGASTALALRRAGLDVRLIDAWEPGHAGAASGGEHRVLRCSHGRDEFYTSWAREARLGWLELGEQTGRELFVQTGAVLLARAGDTHWEDASAEVLAAQGIPHFRCDTDELVTRLPVLDPSGLAYAVWEPEAGFVFAKRATVATVHQFVREGGRLERGRVTTDDQERPWLGDERLAADIIVIATGAWTGSLFPRHLRRMVEVVRQNVIMVAPPAGQSGYDGTHFPCWIDHGFGAYGIPAAGGFGFKAVLVWRQLAIDLDREDRVVDATSIARTRRYLAQRFPGLVDAPITQMAVSQIANTPDTHFIIDRHPDHPDIVLIAGDSGHLFKHGPVLGRFVAEFGLGQRATNPRFTLADRSALAVSSRPQ